MGVFRINAVKSDNGFKSTLAFGLACSTFRPVFLNHIYSEELFVKTVFSSARRLPRVTAIISLTEQIYIPRGECDVSHFTRVILAELQRREHFNLFLPKLSM